MGEDRSQRLDAARPGEPSNQSPPGRWVTVNEAAETLGISVEAIRGRVKRGTVRHERRGNTVYVLLEGDQTPPGRDQSTTSRQPDGDQSEEPEASEVSPHVERLLAAQEREIEYLRGQIGEEREARRRADHIIAALTERIPELEAPPQSAQEAESVAEQASEGESPMEASEEPQQAPSQGSDTPRVGRSWWHRLFGAR